jgi:hypothetical protein
MIVIAGALGGAVLGVWRARRGNRLDRLQFGAAHGIGGAILGLFATIGIERLL